MFVSYKRELNTTRIELCIRLVEAAALNPWKSIYRLENLKSHLLRLWKEERWNFEKYYISFDTNDNIFIDNNLSRSLVVVKLESLIIQNANWGYRLRYYFIVDVCAPCIFAAATMPMPIYSVIHSYTTWIFLCARKCAAYTSLLVYFLFA